MERQYKDSGIEWIGKIPVDWKLQPLAIYFAENRKPNIHLETVNALQFKYGEIIQKPNSGKELTDKDRELLGKYTVVAPNDIVVNGLNLNYDLKSLRIAKVREDGIITSAYIVLRPRIGVNASYYNYYLKALDYQKIFHGMGVGIRLTLSYNELRSMLLSVPSADEQQRIAKYLDAKCEEIDGLIELQEQMIVQLTEYKRSVITEAITKGLNPDVQLVPSGIDWIGDIPKGWKVCRFKDIASVKANLVHPEDYLDYPQIAPDNIEKGSGKLLTYNSVRNANVISDNHLFRKGQLIYSKIRPVLNKIIIAPFDGLCSADMYPIETKNDINYQKYFMLSDFFVSQVAVVVQDRVKMPKINKEELSVIYSLSLPLSEQHAIAEYLDTKCGEIDKLIVTKRQKMDTLKEYKKSVIYEAVTGKIDLRDS